MKKTSYFNKKKILLTGAHGFVGKHVFNVLVKRGINPNDIRVPQKEKSDLRSMSACLNVTKDIDVVIHLAGNVGGIGYNKKIPGAMFYDNITMGVNLIEASRINHVRKFTCISTVCAYPKFTQVPFREENLWEGYPEETNAPYGLAKKVLLVMLQAYKTQYGFNGIYLLPVNMYGPGDNFDPKNSHVIASLIKKIYDAKKNKKKSVSIWGDGTASREFLYVEDAAEAIVSATEKCNTSEPVNIGTGIEVTIHELAHVLVEMFQYKGEIIWDKTKPNGQPRRCLDVSRAREEFGFIAGTKFNEGLKKTITWYKKHPFVD